MYYNLSALDPGTTVLDLTGAGVTDADLHHPARLPRLELLNVSRTYVTSE